MLRIGCSSKSLLPDFAVCLHGYGSRNYRTDKVEDPVELGCLALDNGRNTVLLFCIDIIGISYDVCELLYRELTAATGIAYPDIYICGSHTHFAPSAERIGVIVPGGEMSLGVYPRDEKFLAILREQVLAAAREALAGRRPVQAEYTEISLPGIAFNRRTVKKSDGQVETNYLYPSDPESFHFNRWDDLFSVWRFSDAEGVAAILGRFGCHPVTGGRLGSDHISGEYPYYFRRSVQELFGCPAFFMLGAAGDVVPMQRQGESRRDIGEIMGRSIRMNERCFRPEPEFSLETLKLAVPVTMKNLLNRQHFLQEYEEFRLQAQQQSVMDEEFNHATNIMLGMSCYPTDTLTMPLQFLRLGSHTLVGLPFECLSLLGEKLKAACPNIILTSITGGYEGYLPLQEQFSLGGYEVSGNHFMQNTGDRYLAAAIGKLKELGWD